MCKIDGIPPLSRKSQELQGYTRTHLQCIAVQYFSIMRQHLKLYSDWNAAQTLNWFFWPVNLRLANTDIFLNNIVGKFLWIKWIPLSFPLLFRAKLPDTLNHMCVSGLYLSLSVSSPLKSEDSLFNRPEEREERGLWKDRENRAGERRTFWEREKPRKKRKKTENQEEVGLEGDAPLPGWQTEGPSRARQMRRRGGERERGERKGGEFDVGSQPHHPPTAFPLFLHSPQQKIYACSLSIPPISCEGSAEGRADKWTASEALASRVWC